MFSSCEWCILSNTIFCKRDLEATWDQITTTVFVPIQLPKTLGSCLKQQGKTDILDVEENHSSGKHSNLNTSCTHSWAKIIICVFFASVYRNVISLKSFESYYGAVEHWFCLRRLVSEFAPSAVCVFLHLCVGLGVFVHKLNYPFEWSNQEIAEPWTFH